MWKIFSLHFDKLYSSYHITTLALGLLKRIRMIKLDKVISWWKITFISSMFFSFVFMSNERYIKYILNDKRGVTFSVWNAGNVKYFKVAKL